jgi:hypothetical protein
MVSNKFLCNEVCMCMGSIEGGGGGVEGFVKNSQAISGGREGGRGTL